ncbi:hypothetical protein MSG28_012876 [Choristoneura fumiferana]|uniref:Uncharacterized protein n=1 Tax=Choristoneura fumiferana TaxID=7141 RepID=A0ACC0JIB1_CHOFU|nr:hypothetical protein MSG28_012876 [Choristoneura fumiferana]
MAAFGYPILDVGLFPLLPLLAIFCPSHPVSTSVPSTVDHPALRWSTSPPCARDDLLLHVVAAPPPPVLLARAGPRSKVWCNLVLEAKTHLGTLHPASSSIGSATRAETLGPWVPGALSLFKDLSKRLSDTTGDRRAGSFLAQRISLAIQRGNTASIFGTMPQAGNVIEGLDTRQRVKPSSKEEKWRRSDPIVWLLILYALCVTFLKSLLFPPPICLPPTSPTSFLPLPSRPLVDRTALDEYSDEYSDEDYDIDDTCTTCTIPVPLADPGPEQTPATPSWWENWMQYFSKQLEKYNHKEQEKVSNRHEYQELKRYVQEEVQDCDDLVKIAGSRWMRKAQDRSKCRALGEAYVQQWTSFG